MKSASCPDTRRLTHGAAGYNGCVGVEAGRYELLRLKSGVDEMKNIFKIAAFATTLLLIPAFGYAWPAHGTSSISGRVVDAKYQHELGGVKVAAYADPRTPSSKMLAAALSGKDGSFRLEGLGGGRYQLELTKMGFAVEILSGLSVRANERLVIGEPVGLARASEEYATKMACNTLVRPGEVGSVYVVCAGK